MSSEMLQERLRSLLQNVFVGLAEHKRRIQGTAATKQSTSLQAKGQKGSKVVPSKPPAECANRAN